MIGEPLDRIRDWQSIGLVGRDRADAFDPRDVHRARLVQLLCRRGIPLAAIVEAERQEELIGRYADFVLEGRSGAPVSLQDAATRFGMHVGFVKRFCAEAGIADEGEALYEPDLDALAGVKLALDVGLPEDVLFQLLHVYSDGLGRVAEAESRLFHIYIHGRLKSEGLSGAALAHAVRASGDAVTPLIQPTLLYFHRKSRERALRDDAVLHAREYAGLGDESDALGQMRVAVSFVDLAGFTSLADAMGDAMAARVLERFSHIVRDAVSRFDGRIVKQIGDAFMLIFPEPTSAVACTQAIERASEAEPHFPALRTGIHYGPALYREGDYLGTTVNIAARLAAEAERHQVLVTASVRSELSQDLGANLVPIGRRRLRGLAEDLELFQVVRLADADREPRLVDPVCGMELRPEEAAARLTLDGRDRAFCSQACLQRFIAAPDRYEGLGSRP